MDRAELLQLMAFADAIRTPFQDVCPEDDAASWRIVFALMDSASRERPLTISALAHASELSHGTAMRRLSRMIEAGLIERIPNRMGSRATLRPSPELMARIEDWALKTKRYLAGALGPRSAREPISDYSFSAVPSPTRSLPPTGALQERLAHKRSLTFLLNDDNYFAALRNLWTDLRTNLGRASDFVLLDQAELYREGLANGARTVSKYDLIAIDMPWLGEFASKGLIKPIGAEIRASGVNPLDFNPVIWSTSTWQGEPMGVPIYCTIEVLAYRSDWFETFGLTAPRTFDEVIDTATRFHNPAAERYGVSWNAKRGLPLASSFMFFLASCDASILPVRRNAVQAWAANTDPHEIAPRLEGAALEVLDYMHRLLDRANPRATQMDWDAACGEFMSGQSAMCYVWSMRATRFETDLRSAVSGRVSYLPQPAKPGVRNLSPVGGFLLCIPTNIAPSRHALAVEALTWMSSREAMRVNLQEGFPIAPRFSMTTELEGRRHPKLFNVVRHLANQNLLATWQRPPVPAYTKIEKILGEEVHDALLRVKTDRQALSDAQRRIEAALLSE